MTPEQEQEHEAHARMLTTEVSALVSGVEAYENRLAMAAQAFRDEVRAAYADHLRVPTEAICASGEAASSWHSAIGSMLASDRTIDRDKAEEAAESWDGAWPAFIVEFVEGLSELPGDIDNAADALEIDLGVDITDLSEAIEEFAALGGAW